MGSWDFDESRRETFVQSVRANQLGGSMSEIAAQISMARIQNSSLTFGVDGSGQPELTRTDKATGESERKAITVRREGEGLVFTESDTGAVYRIDPVDRNRITLTEVARKLVIPLKRR